MFGKRQTRYQYQEIAESGTIRLLEIHKGNTKPIKCSLLVTTLDDAPSYHALSYTWGFRTKGTNILLDGCDFPVRPNLAAGLRRLAQSATRTTVPSSDPSALDAVGTNDSDGSEIEIRYIWVDQICINQDDTTERQHQVAQMSQIYSKSERTIVWLGEDDGFAESATDLLARLERAYVETVAPFAGTERPFLMYLGIGAINWDMHKRFGLPPPDSPAWKAMWRFLAFPYWRRVWPIQENVLSQKDPLVICGQTHCSWSMVTWAAHWLYVMGYTNGYVPQTVRCIDTIHQLRSMRLDGEAYDIGSLVLMATSHFATDPRDNIYGILGLEALDFGRVDAGPEFSFIAARYDLPLSLAQASSVRNIIASTRSLAILSLPMRRLPGSWDLYRSFGRQFWWKDYPTWVPHFEDVPNPRRFVNFYKDHYFRLTFHPRAKFAAAGDTSVHMLETGSRPDCLRLIGLQFDTVKVCLHHAPWAALARQNGTSEKTSMSGRARRMQYYLDQCGHYGYLQLALYGLHIIYSSQKTPFVLEVWRTAVEHSRYEKPLDVAKAVLEATTAGLDATYRRWTENGLSHLCSFISYLLKSRKVRGMSPRVKTATQALLEYAQEHPQGDAKKYALAMQFWCGSRRFFVTGKGLIGIGPSSMRQGDVICVLFGGGAPFVLRPKDGHWLFVGDCYVDDLMQGQAVNAFRQGHLKQQIFEIY